MGEFYFEEGCFITELWNNEKDEGMSVARARVLPGETTRWHSLQGITERYLIQEGTGRVEIGDAPPHEVKTGDVVLIPGGVRQRITNTGAVDLIFLAICTPRFRPDFYRDQEVS